MLFVAIRVSKSSSPPSRRNNSENFSDKFRRLLLRCSGLIQCSIRCGMIRAENSVRSIFSPS